MTNCYKIKPNSAYPPGIVSKFEFSRIWFLCFIVLTACSSQPIELKGVNIASWKGDTNGCNNLRRQWVPLILDQKEKILAQTESSIIQLLGKPDGIELYDRNQKLYHYQVSPSSACLQKDSLNTELLIRFNAMGRAKEIYSYPN